MISLALETCFGKTSIALFQADELIYSFKSETGNQAEEIPSIVEGALAEAGLSFADIDNFIVDVGPGSFTGIRVGIAYIIGLKIVFKDAEFYGVSCLDIMQDRHAGKMVAVDAGKKQVFAKSGQDIFLVNYDDLNLDIIVAESERLRDYNIDNLVDSIEAKDLLGAKKKYDLEPIYVRNADALPQISYDIYNGELEIIDDIVKVQNDNFYEKWTRDDFIKLLDNDAYNLYYYKYKDEIIAYMVFTIIGDECEIISIAVVDGYKRRCFASKLINDIVKLDSVSKCFLEVHEQNQAAINLYKKHGFKESSRRKNYYKEKINGKNDAINYLLVK